jgi:site-specific DNA recombinase
VTVRVAIYTRKSVSEGLDQQFNTLDAQREAVEAYVQSQRGEGWAALPERYDDGGYTGANTDRPAFQRLLRDIEAGKVDTVAVYKFDRLSRRQIDFLRTLELFEEQGVGFVSVTQHLDTSTSMGRCMMNVMSAFAQLEREVISERTRDKIRASRAKGLWTGGRPVLGYDIDNKRLAVNEEEAEQVRATFALYLEYGSLLAVVDELKKRAWTTKSWTNKKGRLVLGRPFTKDSVHGLLTNPLYLGKVRCGDVLHDGAHEAIVDEKTWYAVQERLKSNAGGRAGRGKRKHDALLAGLARCGVCGSAMSPHHTKKGSRRYAYYVCVRQQKEGARICPGSRVPAGDLESFVLDRVRAIGQDHWAGPGNARGDSGGGPS